MINGADSAATLFQRCKNLLPVQLFPRLAQMVLDVQHGAGITDRIGIRGGDSCAGYYKTLSCSKIRRGADDALLDGTTLRILAVNHGDAPASLIRARISGDYLAGATKVRLRDDSDAIIPPGGKLLTFDLIPLLNEEQSYSGSLDAIKAIMTKTPLPPTQILFGLAQSDGRFSMLRYDVGDNDMFLLLRNNADRCSGIDKPNFTNGCVGNGMPQDGPDGDASGPLKNSR